MKSESKSSTHRMHGHTHHHVHFDEITQQFYDEGEIPKIQKSSTFQATVNSMKVLLGIAIIAMPHGFANGGLLAGIFGLIIVCTIGLCTLIMQSDSSSKI